MIKYNTHMYKILIISIIISSILSLHIKQQSLQHRQTSLNQQQQLNYLIGLQTNYAQGITTLNTQTQTLRGRLEQLIAIDDKIKLLESAITSQRAKISQLSSTITPNPFLSGSQCQILTQDQQQKLNKQISLLQLKIKQLQYLISLIPDGQQKNALKTQLQKMKINLLNIQNTSTKQCQQNILQSQTVYITNLYNNNNWILGTYTMDKLIDQYYQIYKKYSNITNCPLDRPFLSSLIPINNINLCINCPDSKPIYDISIKTCIACPIDQALDIANKKCSYMPRNSNYTYGNNYRLQPLSQIPPPIANLTSCPVSAPFYNGTLCVQCLYPNYWQISESKCYTCPTDQVFSINLHKCLPKTTLNKKLLTVLNNTQWISNNPSQVYTDRQNIININKTTGQYQLCNISSPYYDNIACINCQNNKQFNLDTLQCVSAPQNYTYSKNLHKYVQKQYNKQMDPKTLRYITSQILTDDPNIPNCNTSFPYYDGISCIYCIQPYNIFDYDNKICTICPNTTLYNQTMHKCIPRPLIYIYGNRDRMLATQNYNIQDYNNTLNQAIINNPQFVPTNCPDPLQYAAISKCVKCDPNTGWYFNIHTYQCTYCDGIPDPLTSKCKQRQYYFVNTAASNLLIPNTTTLQQINNNNNQIISSNPLKYSICPIQQPYPYNNKTICGKCPTNAPLYSIQLQGCTYCSSPLEYDQYRYKCSNITYLTNYDKNIIITPPQTQSSLLHKQLQLNKTTLTKKCPSLTPYTPDGRICINCLNTAPYYDINKGICVICTYPMVYNVQKKGCYQIYYLTNLAAPRLLQVENYTVINVRNQQVLTRQNTSISYQDCPIQRPYAQLTMCINCSQNMIYNLKTQNCQYCPTGSSYWQNTRKCIQYINITNINSTNAYIIQTDIYTLNNYKTQIQKQKLLSPTQLCPNQLPYSINGICATCPPNAPYFILSTKTCTICDNYQFNTMTCPPKPTRYPNLTNFYWITNDGNADKYINDGIRLKSIATGPICPAFYNQTNKQCFNCPDNSFYNYDNKQCQICPSDKKFDINIHTCTIPFTVGSYFTNIQSSPNNLQIYGGLTLNQIQTTQKNIKSQYPNSLYCSNDKPFFDDIQCIKCPQYKKYFNLRHRLCQVCLYGQTLIGNDCINTAGNKVWQEPVAQNVYPFLFSNV